MNRLFFYFITYVIIVTVVLVVVAVAARTIFACQFDLYATANILAAQFDWQFAYIALVIFSEYVIYNGCTVQQGMKQQMTVTKINERKNKQWSWWAWPCSHDRNANLSHWQNRTQLNTDTDPAQAHTCMHMLHASSHDVTHTARHHAIHFHFDARTQI